MFIFETFYKFQLKVSTGSAMNYGACVVMLKLQVQKICFMVFQKSFETCLNTSFPSASILYVVASATQPSIFISH